MENNKKLTGFQLQGNIYRHGLLPFGIMLLLIVGGLLGCLAIYSARFFAENTAGFMLKQMKWLSAGMILFMIAALVPFRWYRKISFTYFILHLFLLIIVFFCGTRINGMRGWFDFGFCHIQPSEFAKAAFVLYLCVYCGKQKELGLKNWMYLLFISSVTIFLIMIEPDFGGGLIFFIIFMLVLCLRGVSLQYLLTALIGMALGCFLFISHNDYAMKRILGYLDPDGAFSTNAWHIKQFQYTMAHGGWLGADQGNTLWSGAFLPLPHTDSLYASIVEATGFVGGILVILGFVAMAVGFCLLSWKIKGNNDDRRFFIFCAGSMTLVQALIHISVNSVLIPPTGVTLPILSYGGSSLLSVLLLFGIAFSAANDSSDEI